MLHLMELEIKEQTKPRVSTREEITKKTEINDLQCKKIIEKYKETEMLLGRIKKINKLLARYTRKKRKDSNKIRN